MLINVKKGLIDLFRTSCLKAEWQIRKLPIKANEENIFITIFLQITFEKLSFFQYLFYHLFVRITIFSRSKLELVIHWNRFPSYITMGSKNIHLLFGLFSWTVLVFYYDSWSTSNGAGCFGSFLLCKRPWELSLSFFFVSYQFAKLKSHEKSNSINTNQINLIYPNLGNT
jgi:hypothetical protein